MFNLGQKVSKSELIDEVLDGGFIDCSERFLYEDKVVEIFTVFDANGGPSTVVSEIWYGERTGSARHLSSYPADAIFIKVEDEATNGSNNE